MDAGSNHGSAAKGSGIDLEGDLLQLLHCVTAEEGPRGRNVLFINLYAT